MYRVMMLAVLLVVMSMPSPVAIATAHGGDGRAMLEVIVLGDSISGDLPTIGGWRRTAFQALASEGRSPFSLGRIVDPLGYGGHEAHPGWTTTNALNELSSIYAAVGDRDINQVWLMLGTNDIWGAGTAAPTAARLAKIIDILHVYWPRAQFIASTIPPFGRLDLRVENEAYNALLPGVMATRGRLVQPPLTLDDLLDSVHPNAQGLAKITGAFLPAIHDAIDHPFVPMADAPAANLQVTLGGKVYRGTATLSGVLP